MRGRRPKPTAVKRLTGNPGGRALNSAEPRPDPSRPYVPRWLSEGAKEEWGRVAGRLHDAGLLTYVDQATLAAYCEAYARWRKAEQALQEEGAKLILETDKGYRYPNPLIGVAQTAMRDMLRVAAEFGMTPSARSRVRVPQDGEEEPSLAEILYQSIGAGYGD